MGPDTQKDFLKSKGEAEGIKDFDIILNDRYIDGIYIDGAVAVGIIFFAIFIMFASSFVIYSKRHKNFCFRLLPKPYTEAFARPKRKFLMSLTIVTYFNLISTLLFQKIWYKQKSPYYQNHPANICSLIFRIKIIYS